MGSKNGWALIYFEMNTTHWNYNATRRGMSRTDYRNRSLQNYFIITVKLWFTEFINYI